MLLHEFEFSCSYWWFVKNFFLTKQNSEKTGKQRLHKFESAGDALAKQHEQKTMKANLLIIGKKKVR